MRKASISKIAELLEQIRSLPDPDEIGGRVHGIYIGLPWPTADEMMASAISGGIWEPWFDLADYEGPDFFKEAEAVSARCLSAWRSALLTGKPARHPATATMLRTEEAKWAAFEPAQPPITSGDRIGRNSDPRSDADEDRRVERFARYLDKSGVELKCKSEDDLQATVNYLSGCVQRGINLSENEQDQLAAYSMRLQQIRGVLQ